MQPKSAATWASLIGAGLLLALSQSQPRGETGTTSPQGLEVQEAPTARDHPAHPHEDGAHEPWWHRLQDWAIGILGGVHHHETENAHEGHLEPLALTLFTEQTELFAELPPLVLGDSSELLVHLTRLADFKPVTEGEVRVTLSGGDSADESFASPAPARPGLFRVRVTPAVPGERRMRVTLAASDLLDSHDLGVLAIHPDHEAAEAAAGTEHPEHGGIVLLKEQQWRADFATGVAERRLLRGSVPATGLLRPSADGEAHVTTPIDAHLRSAPEGFPYTGMPVEAGQIIAYLVPKLGGEADVAGLELAVTRAASIRDLARQERERLDALWEQRSIPYREVLQARSAEEVAGAELAAASKRLAQVKRTPEGEGAGVPVRAPISGVVARVQVAPGGFVEEGARLFHLVDAERLWLEARVAEADIGQILEPRGAWFRAQGFDPVFEVSPQNGSRLVAFGSLVDPESRTVPVIFELRRPDPRLRVGQSVTARVFTGAEQDALVVPAGALVNDAGAEVVYVQTGGERFERRLVRTGLRDGEHVAIEDGLSPGERVVTRGAYLVHLAAGAPAKAGHGHAH
jgi:membrane fusion protein, heavy metal efflux system